MELIVIEVHKPIKKVKNYRKVISHYKNNIWSLDLIELLNFQDVNNGYKYILNCIDLYSRYAWSIPLKNKTDNSVLDAFLKIVNNTNTKPEFIWTDEGKEFYNKKFNKYRQDNNIILYSTYGVAKSSVIERLNRTLKSIMYKKFTLNGNHIWYNILDEIVNKYNNSKHRSIKDTPENVYKNNIITNENLDIINVQKNNPKFKINDRVRISYKRGLFDKSYYPNWSYEIFKISEVLKTNPVTYKLKDYKDNIIKGSFYNEELQLTKLKPDVFLVEKVLQTRRRANRKLFFVKFLGYPESENQWIDQDDITDLNNIQNL